MILFFVTNAWVIAVDYKTPYFRDNNNRTPSLRYGWMATTKSATLLVLPPSGINFSRSDIERYVKLKMRNFYKDLKFINSFWIDPMNIEINVEIDKYNKNSSLYYGFITFSVVPDERARESVSRNYRITTSIIGEKHEMKNLIKKNIDLFIENFAEDTYKMQDTVELYEKFILDSRKIIPMGNKRPE